MSALKSLQTGGLWNSHTRCWGKEEKEEAKRTILCVYKFYWEVKASWKFVWGMNFRHNLLCQVSALEKHHAGFDLTSHFMWHWVKIKLAIGHFLFRIFCLRTALWDKVLLKLSFHGWIVRLRGEGAKDGHVWVEGREMSISGLDLWGSTGRMSRNIWCKVSFRECWGETACPWLF